MLISTHALVLAGHKLGEADTLVTLLTMERGLMKGVAKGVRRLKSRFGSALQPFTYGDAIVFEARADLLDRINHLDVIHSFRALREDLDLMTHAAVMANAARALLADHQPARETFTELLRAFRALEAEENGARTVVFFLLALVCAAGYQPRLDRCLVGRHPIDDGSRVRFVPSLGGAVCAVCHGNDHTGRLSGPGTVPLSADTHAFLRHALRLPSRLRARLHADPPLLGEAQRLLAACIAEHARRTPTAKNPWRTAPGRETAVGVNAGP